MILWILILDGSNIYIFYGFSRRYAEMLIDWHYIVKDKSSSEGCMIMAIVLVDKFDMDSSKHIQSKTKKNKWALPYDFHYRAIKCV